jgi:protoporphyrinogen oxidase
MLDFAILGGGISGISMGRLLDLKKKVSYQVFEAEEKPGGLCRTEVIDGHVLDTGGGHFLCTKYPDVYDFIFSHLPKSEFNYFDRVSKIAVSNATIDYPIESNIWQLPVDDQVRYLVSVAQAGEVNGKKEPKNYSEWILWKLGQEISEQYMEPYNKKIWGVSPSEMDIDWLHKIPRLDIQDIFKASLSKENSLDKFPSHQGFYYPKVGGFQGIFDSIYEKVKSNVVLKTKITELEWNGQYWLINNSIKAKKIINTIPWPLVFKANGEPSSLSESIKKLQSNSLVVSLYESDYSHNYHWQYIPDEGVNHHREFYVHNFAPHSKPNTLYTETNKKRWQAGTKLGKAKPLYEHVNEFAYPIPVLGHAKAAAEVISYYHNMHMYGLGRWGQWQYFNSDVCIKQAIDLVEKL